MAGHLAFIFALFGPQTETPSLLPSLSIFLSQLQMLLPAFLAMFASHTFSYFSNYIGKGEYKGMAADKLFVAPYGRIVLMHVTIIGSGWLITIFHAPMFGILLLTVFKILFDVHAHLKEHKISFKSTHIHP